jgi:hypothetical protein
MAGRRASYEAVTTTHIQARSPRQDSLRHTPHKGLGATGGISWLTVPTGIALPPGTRARLSENSGPSTPLDLRYGHGRGPLPALPAKSQRGRRYRNLKARGAGRTPTAFGDERTRPGWSGRRH